MIQGHSDINDLDSLHKEQHRKLFFNSLGIIDKVFTSVPTANQIPVGYLAKYINGTTYRIYINISDTLYYFALTKA
jgi:hypothetical protein